MWIPAERPCFRCGDDGVHRSQNIRGRAEQNEDDMTRHALPSDEGYLGNILDEGLMIGGRGRRMNSKIKVQTNKTKLDAC
jgi:hypothetical protein